MNEKRSSKKKINKVDVKQTDAQVPGRLRSDSLESVAEDMWPIPPPSTRPDPLYDLYSVVNHVGALGK
jgi:hypothetical protein